MYKNMLLEERMARVDLEQRIEAQGGVVPSPPPAQVAQGSGAGGGGSSGPGVRLMGGIRRLQRTNSWGRKGSPGGAKLVESTAGSGSKQNQGPGGAASFFKGVRSGINTLATDLADGVLGTDPSVASSTTPSQQGSASRSGPASASGPVAYPGMAPVVTPDSSGSVGTTPTPGPPPPPPPPRQMQARLLSASAPAQTSAGDVDGATDAERDAGGPET